MITCVVDYVIDPSKAGAPSTSNTDLYSVTIRTSLPQTGTGMRVVAC
jgi:hypothetical protein